MAYIGVARPVIARYVEREGEISYLDGFRFGKAIKVSVSPNYEDVSDYGGINDTEEEQEFSYAEIALNTNKKRNTVRGRKHYVWPYIIWR